MFKVEASVPARVSVLLAVSVLPSAIVSVDAVAGARVLADGVVHHARVACQQLVGVGVGEKLLVVVAREVRCRAGVRVRLLVVVNCAWNCQVRAVQIIAILPGIRKSRIYNTDIAE